MRGGLQAEVLAWLDAVFEALREGAAPGSALRAALQAEGVDLLETLRAPLYVAALRLARGQAPAPPPSRARALGWQAKRGLQGIQAALGAAPPAPVDQLFWPRDPTHSRQQLPVAAALRALGGAPGFVASTPREAAALAAAGEAYLWPARSFAPRLAVALADGLAAAGRLEGISLPPLPPGPGALAGGAPLREAGPTLRQVLATQRPEVGLAAATAWAALAATRPKRFIAGHDLTLEGRAATLAAEAAGVPTACLVHGVGSGNPLLGRYRSQQVLCYGPTQAEALVSLGLRPDQVFVVGAPYLDTLSLRGAPPTALARAFDLRPGRPWVLVATSGPGDRVSAPHHAAFVEAICAAAAQRPDLSWVVKLHPKEPAAPYEEALGRHPSAPLQLSRGEGLPGDIFQWLDGCAALITAGSTVAMEAMVAGVPVLTLDLAGELEGVDFIQARATTHLLEAEALGPALAARLEAGEPERPEAVARYLAGKLGPLDGGAAARAAGVLMGGRWG